MTDSSQTDGDPPPGEDGSETLLCMLDNVAVSAEDPRCLHPSSLCRFREFCEVILAARKKKRSEGRDDPA